MKKFKLLALALMLLLSVSALPLQAIADSNGSFESLQAGDFSFFAGTYSAYQKKFSGYGGGKPLPDLTLDAGGKLSGKPTSYSPAISFNPSSITKNGDGSYTCLNYGSVNPSNGRPTGMSAEAYILYPVGVADPYGMPTDVVRLMYVILDGGVMEIVYQNTTAPTGNGVNQSVPTAYATTQEVPIDDTPVKFETYALKDENGNLSNYIKLRDLALQLNDTAAQFSVGWDDAIIITSGEHYEPIGSEMRTPYSGDQPYEENTSPLIINGKAVNISAIVLHDAAGGGYTYFKLRDLGKALNFNVSWIDGKVVINTDETYSDAA